MMSKKGGTEDAEETTLEKFEDILEVVGTRGRWNILMFTMCSLVNFVSPLHTLTYQFLGATPDHWCLVPELQAANWSQHQVLTLAIPYSKNSSKYDGCRMYDYDYAAAVEMGYEAALANRANITESSNLKICSSRDFNLTQYKSTTVTEWDLVCERRSLYSTTQAIVMAGKLVSYLIFGYLIDRWGRRPITLITTVFYILSAFLIAVSPNIQLYITLNFIIAAMDSGQYLGLFVIMMENCAVRYRAVVSAISILPWAVGYMAVPCIAYFIRDWQLLHVAYAVPVLYFIIFFWFLPESPRWLVTQSKFQEALKVLTWAAKVNKRTLPPDDVIINSMANIQKQATMEVEPKARVDELVNFRWVLRRGLSTLKQFSILFIIPQLRVRTLVIFFCWFTCSIVYFGVAFNASNLGTNPYLYVFLSGLLEVPSYLLMWPALVFIDRKKLLFALYLFGGACIFTVMFVMLIEPKDSELLMVVLSQSGKVAITIAFQMLWTYTAELYPTNLRSLGVGESSFCARVGGLLAPYINDLLGVVVSWSPSALFGALSLASAGLTLLLPETRNTVLSEALVVQKKNTHREGNAREENMIVYSVKDQDNLTHVRDISTKM